MNNLNKKIFKSKFKNLLKDLLFYLIIFVLSWIYDKWLVMLSFICTYTIIRSEFLKAVHGSDFTDSPSKAIKYCRIITFIVQVLSIIFMINIDISKYVNILLAFILGVINFFTKDYLEYALRKIVFFKGMKVDDIPKELKGIEYEIIYQYYVKRYKIDKIAINLNYSVDHIKRLKRMIIKRYSKK